MSEFYSDYEKLSREVRKTLARARLAEEEDALMGLAVCAVFGAAEDPDESVDVSVSAHFYGSVAGKALAVASMVAAYIDTIQEDLEPKESDASDVNSVVAGLLSEALHDLGLPFFVSTMPKTATRVHNPGNA